LWQNYDEEAEKAAYEKRRQETEPKGPKQELVDVIVTEIVDATKFYVQIVGKGEKFFWHPIDLFLDAEKLDELMQTIAQKDKGTEAYTPKFGELVLAQFTADDAWYRAKAQEPANGEVRVMYIDYGNVSLAGKISVIFSDWNRTHFSSETSS
jgi:staphylococcal nuclease domain-containing protein 1